MKVNTAVARILAGQAVSAEDIVKCLAVAVDPTKIGVLNAGLTGTLLAPVAEAPVAPAVTIPAVSPVALAPVVTPARKGGLGRTDAQKALAGEYFAAAKAGTLGTILKGRSGHRSQVVTTNPADVTTSTWEHISYADACTLSGIPTRKNGLVNA